MANLYYQGHGSFRITTDEGFVIYVDPYAGDGYDLPADLILVSHGHHDHNCVALPAKKPACTVLTYQELLTDQKYDSKTVGPVRIDAVQAYNKNHPRTQCVGFVLFFNGISLYAAGDTSTTEDMRCRLPQMHLDYALLPTDGVYNMGPQEAGSCAAMIAARCSIPIHTKPSALFDETVAKRFDAPGKMVIKPGQSVELKALSR